MDDARAKRLTLIACILGSAIVFVDGTVVNVALPALGADLDASLADQQWVVESYLLMLASLVLVGGSLGDLYGRRRIFEIGVVGFGAASLICAISPTVELLIVARGIQGAAGALLVPSSLAIITEVFGPEERGAAIGSWTAGTSAAIAIGPPLGGLLVDVLSWRVIFAMNVPLVLACLWLIVRYVPECPGDGLRRIDVPGAALCVLGLAGPVYALIEQPRVGWSDPTVWVPLLAGLGACGAFIAYERRAADPMLPLSLFSSRNFAVGNAVTFIVYAGLGSATFFIALFLQQVAGYTAFQAGLSLLPITLLLVTLARRFGALSARVGPRLPLSIGPLVSGAGLLLFSRLDQDADYLTGVLPASALFGLGLAVTVAPLTATVLQAVDSRQAGVASGTNNAIARIAALVAIAAVGAVVAAQFSAAVDERLPDSPLAPAARAYVDDARDRPLALPDGAVDVRVRDAVRDAGVDAFAAGMIASALLMIAGGLLAAIGIKNPPRAREAAVERPAPAAA